MKNLKIIKKAWKVWVDNEEFDKYPYFSDYDMLTIVYADNITKAKYQCEFEWDNFIEIKAKRSKNDDIVLYNNKEISRESVKYYEQKEKNIKNRTKEIMKFPENSLFYAQRGEGGYVGNSVYLWALNGNGYTINPDKAHKYTRQQVIDEFIKQNSDTIFWEANHLESKISKHVDSQHLNREFKI